MADYSYYDTILQQIDELMKGIEGQYGKELKKGISEIESRYAGAGRWMPSQLYGTEAEFTGELQKAQQQTMLDMLTKKAEIEQAKEEAKRREKQEEMGNWATWAKILLEGAPTIGKGVSWLAAIL